MEQWRFIIEPEGEHKTGRHPWRWVHKFDDGHVQHSGQLFSTLWVCVKDASRVGYDDESMGPLMNAGDHTMVALVRSTARGWLDGLGACARRTDDVGENARQRDDGTGYGAEPRKRWPIDDCWNEQASSAQ